MTEKKSKQVDEPKELHKLNKSDLLQGRNKVTDVFFEELGGTLPLRPLTDGQFSQLQEIRLRGVAAALNPETKMIDFAGVTHADYIAHIQTCVFGIALDDGPMTADEVKALRPAGIVAKIAQKIYELSGADPGQVIDLLNFRTLDRGEGDVPPAPDGAPTGQKSGRPNPGTKAVPSPLPKNSK